MINRVKSEIIQTHVPVLIKALHDASNMSDIKSATSEFYLQVGAMTSLQLS